MLVAEEKKQMNSVVRRHFNVLGGKNFNGQNRIDVTILRRGTIKDESVFNQEKPFKAVSRNSDHGHSKWY